MRKVQKMQAENFLRTLGQAHKELEKLMENSPNTAAAACEILEDCQQGAVILGSMIEASEGGECAVVTLLEEYCEFLYLIYRQLTEDAGQVRMPTDHVSEHLCKYLEQMKHRMENDVSVRMEAVFLPYNASMWDSMESVWKAAAEDDLCDAYVVPIPYYDKNPDGSFGKMHYEGDRLPADVPVVSWKDYDLAERLPDMVFIHNPYDDGNIVTSVYPDYYASELKKYVSDLVYIPYFLFVNDHVSENMVITKGVFYADYVVVQSEECGRKCIQIYDEYRERNGLQRKFKAGKDKFLPLGSPIIDRTSGKAEWDTVPPEWKQKIWKKNTRKKVVFYNTHLSDVMYINAERFFIKIKNVLNVFQQQPDIVLLWRPHPLTWQTIQAMNPAAAEEYQKIVDDYCAQDWGIYDNTSDLARSVCISDAYYGDWSSVVTMFREAGKPVMMQDLNVIND